MAININSNIFSLLVQKNLASATKTLNDASNRVSSGLRINTSADDPAGMATSEHLRYQILGTRQNQQNVSSGISMVGTAESNIDQTIAMLQRARELAVQGGNDTLNAQNRQALQQEYAGILQEIDRTATTASFGDRKLFNGTFQGARIQVGTGSSDFIAVSLGDYRTNILGAQAKIVSAGPVNATPLAAGQITINGVDVPGSTVDGYSTVNAASSAMAKANAINQIETQTGVHATAIAASLTGVSAVTPVNIDNATNTLSINGILVPPTVVAAGDGNRSLMTAINQQSNVTGVTASIDASGVLSLKAIDGRNVEVVTGGNVAQKLGLSASAGAQTFELSGTVQLSSSSPFTVADPAGLIGLGASQQVAVDPSTALGATDMNDPAKIADTIRSIDTAINQLSADRSRLGVLSTRLQSLTTTLAQQSDNLTQNDSRIRDADFALETARMTQAQILQQAAIAMLTQANDAPKRALALLQN